ncbi:MAG TPA: Ig-like domain-containing protein [Streptosporangiaceae bacterium]|nr:Ig-like domain-containing protein [Streptosporangiaceae bacterium]
MRRWSSFRRPGAALALLPGVIGILAVAASPASAISNSPVGHWGEAKRISLAGLKATDGEIDEMSCSGRGGCTAAGTYHDAAGVGQVFVVSEVNGTWGQASAIPGLNALNKGPFDAVDAISCESPGDCAIGGSYPNADGEFQPFVADSVNGEWGPAHTLVRVHTGHRQFTAAVTSLSCTVDGYCAAGVTLPSVIIGSGGQPEVIPNAFLASETNGSWSDVQAVPAFDGMHAPSEINSISCWAPGDCEAGGIYSDLSGHRLPLIAEQSASGWHAEQLPGVSAISGYNPNGDAGILDVSCLGGTCAVSGTYQDASFGWQDFVSDGFDDQWHTQTVPGSLELNQGLVSFPLVSCGNFIGDCAFTSVFQDSTRHDHVLVATESSGIGTWGTAQEVLGIDTVPSAAEQTLSCGGPGSCVIGGLYRFDSSGRSRAYIAEEIHGTWGAARRVAGNLDAGNFSSTNIVSCVRAGNCSAGGSYLDAQDNQQPFVDDESTRTIAGLSLSAAKAAYDREPTVQVSVKITPRSGGIPTGTVTIAANSTTICDATLTAGAATCALGAGRLSPGQYDITASYGGDQTYDPSRSQRMSLTITPEPTSAKLTLSAATVKFGHERAEHLNVQVKPRTSGIPAGRVTIKAGAVKLCAFSLAKGKGTCSLKSKQLKPGTYHLVATYQGTGWHGSKSARRTLTVTK